MNRVRERFIKRFNPIASTVAILLSYSYDEFWVAGSSLLKPIPNDFDIYSSQGFDFNEIKKRAKSFEYVHVLWESRNALTMVINGTKIQFCQYQQPDLKALLASFDFAHVQIGIEVEINWEPGAPEDGGGYNDVTYHEVQTTEAWKAAMYEQDSIFTGSDYPLSSLLRVHKYRQRDWLTSQRAKTSILLAMAEVIKRGYEDYNDFKDQLRAVDLQLLEPEQSEAAWNLWCICCDRGLVRNIGKTNKHEFMEGWDD